MKKLSSTDLLHVGLQFDSEIIPVGRLGTSGGRIFFEYNQQFIQSGIEISPFKLPLVSGVHSADYLPFEGLYGVFNDSLPDGWGRLLFDRLVKSKQQLPEEFTPLDRLAHIGNSGLGALVYEPDFSISSDKTIEINLDVLSAQTKSVLDGGANEVLQELIRLNGSSAGARPKAFISLNASKNHIISGESPEGDDYERWLVKFPNLNDGLDAGAIEYIYTLMAKNAGIEMMPVHLFEASVGAGYFATQRFDRSQKQRLHVHSASGLLHTDFRTPSMDYTDLIKLTSALTKDVRQVEKMFRLAVFNVLAHNRDDHSKNFSFLMDATGEWTLAPAYDLTFSSGPRGQQSTMVFGEGRSPSIEHLSHLGNQAGLKGKLVVDIIEQTQAALREWNSLAKTFGVSRSNISLIESRLMTS